MRNVLDKFIDKIEKQVLWPVTFFFFGNCALYLLMWETKLEPEMPHVTTWHMQFSHWLQTHILENVIIVASLSQQWL